MHPVREVALDLRVGGSHSRWLRNTPSRSGFSSHELKSGGRDRWAADELAAQVHAFIADEHPRADHHPRHCDARP